MAAITSTTESWNTHKFSEVESHIKGSYSNTSHSHAFSNITGSLSEAQMNNGLNALPTGGSNSDIADYCICQYAEGGTSHTEYYRRPFSKIAPCILNQLSSSNVTSALGYTPANGSNYVHRGGDSMWGSLTLYTDGTGDSPFLYFKRGTYDDNYWDWRIWDSSGSLCFGINKSGTWTTPITFDGTNETIYIGTSQVVHAGNSSHTHSEYSLTSHSHSNYSLTSHTHSNYSLTSHTHSEYAASTTRNFTAGGAGWTVYSPYTTDVNLDNYYSSTSHTHSYLPLSGGNMSGHIYLTGAVENSSTSNTSQIVFGTSSNNHVVITSNKNAIIINPTIGSTANQMELGVNGHYSRIAGDLTVNGGVTSLSDIRKKDVIGDAELSIDDIASAPLIRFTWKEFKDRGEQVGTIAQYWEKILPQVIVERHDYLNLNYGVAALVSSITTAKDVVAMKEVIKKLEERISELEK